MACAPNRQVSTLQSGNTCSGETRATQVEVYCPDCGVSFCVRGGDEGLTEKDIVALAANDNAPCQPFLPTY